MDRTTVKLSRKTLESAAKELPISAILGRTVSDGLTTKQKKFAREIAMGATKADAYRAAYNVTSPSSVRNDPYRIASDPRIAREIEAYTLAIEAEKHRSPSALRSLVIQTLTQTLIDPDVKPSVRLQAAKILGTVTEVAAFTERKEVRTISSSEDARQRVMSELRTLMAGNVTDIEAVDVAAETLLAELSGNVTGGNVTDDSGNVADAAGGNVTGGNVTDTGGGNVTDGNGRDGDPTLGAPPAV
jgi:hypothetical protein